MEDTDVITRVLNFELTLATGRPSDQCIRCRWKGLATHDTCPDCGSFLQAPLNIMPEEEYGDTVVGQVRFDTETGTMI